MQKKLISVIVPVYKAEIYLPRCLDSILSQTYKNLEIILIDDGSPDRCSEICDEYAKVDSRIHVIHQSNVGVSASRNIGIDMASGNYIAFIDSDDWIEKNYFARYIHAAGPLIDVVLSPYVRDDGIGNIEQIFSLVKSENWDKERAIREILSWRHIGWGPVSCLFKKSVIANIKFPLNMNYGEDLYFKYFALKQCKSIQYIPYAGYHYFINPNSACHTYDVIKKMQDLPLIEYILKEEPEENTRIFFVNQYIFRLITYYKEFLLRKEFSKKIEIHDMLLLKIRNNMWKAICSKESNIKMRLSILVITIFPDSILKMIFKGYSLISKKKV